MWCLQAAHLLLLCEPQYKIIMADKSLGLRPSWKEIRDFVLKRKPNRLHLSCCRVTRLIHDFTLYLLLFFASLSSCCVRGMSFVSIHFLLQGHSFSFFTLVKLSCSYRYRCLWHKSSCCGCSWSPFATQCCKTLIRASLCQGNIRPIRQ